MASSAMKVDALVEVMEQHNVQVLAITETWIREQSKDDEIRIHLKTKGWLWEGRMRLGQNQSAPRGSGGVAIMVKQQKDKSSSISVMETKKQQEGVLWAKVQVAGVTMNVGAVYLAPVGTTGGWDVKAEDTVTNMKGFHTDEAGFCRIGHGSIMLGDFNARVGCGRQTMAWAEGEDMQVSRVLVDEKENKRGKRLLNLCNEVGLVLATGARGAINEFTCSSQKGGSVVDHICVSQDMWRQVLKVGIPLEGDYEDAVKTDHKLLCVDFQDGRPKKGANQRRPDKKKKKKQRWSTDDGGDRKHWDALKKKCQETKDWWVKAAEELKQDGNKPQAEEMWSRFKRWATTMLKKCVGVQKRRMRGGKVNWLKVDPEIQANKKECKEILKEIKKNMRRKRKAKTLWKTLAKLRKARRKLGRSIFRESRRTRVRNFENLRCRDPKKMWANFKKLMGKNNKGAEVPQRVKSQDGVIKGGVEAEQIWTEAYRKLGVQDLDDKTYRKHEAEKIIKKNGSRARKSNKERGSKLDAPISKAEVEQAVKRLKRGKATGADGIPNEFMKEGGEGVIEVLWKLIGQVWGEEAIPQDWAEGLVTPLFKEGDKQDVNNYRGITLLATVGKVFCSILDTRLTAYCEDPRFPRLREEQGGFRPGRACEDLIFVLSEMIKKRAKLNKMTFCCFIDIRKAYDGVFREGLWEKMWEMGIRGKMWRVIRDMYKKTRSQMLINGKALKEFKIEEGVRQGCVLSPKLFSIFFNDLVKHINVGKFGVQIDDTSAVKIQALLYADDIVLMADTKEELQRLIQKVQDYSEVWRFSMNKGKTKVLVFNSTPKEREAMKGDFCIGKTGEDELEEVQIVTRYKYLGMEMESGDFTFKYYKDKVAKKARKALYTVRAMGVSAGYMSVSAAEMVWKALVRSLMEYGAAVLDGGDGKVWKEAEAIQIQMARYILGVGKQSPKTAARGGTWVVDDEGKTRSAEVEVLGEASQDAEAKVDETGVPSKKKGIANTKRHRRQDKLVLPHPRVAERAQVGPDMAKSRSTRQQGVEESTI